MSNNLEHLETQYWVETIICHPELEDQCPWGKLGSSAWHDILMERPELIRHAPRKITLSFMSANQWLDVLNAHPELDSYVPSGKSLFKKDSEALGKLWGILLSRHPEFAKYEPWKHLRRDDWRRVLSQQPQFIDKYESDRYRKDSWQCTLSALDLAEVIACQPSLFERFKTDNLIDNAWVTILLNQPQFREKCNLNRIAPLFLGRILGRYPEWLSYCDIYSMTPYSILRVAENFPDILKHYDLDRFKEISYDDTPWIEKYPCLVPYSKWCFSYSYWDAIMTHCSDWLATGKRPIIDALAGECSSHSSQGTRRGGTNKLVTRPRKEKNLRNSIDEIMDCLYWGNAGCLIHEANVIPLRIRKILDDTDLTYEQLMIKMSMMSEEDCGKIFYGLVISKSREFLEQMVDHDLDRVIQMVPVKYILPLSILFASTGTLFSVLWQLISKDSNAIADFRDAAGNNVWHYFFFRLPMFCPSGKGEVDSSEYENYKLLTKYGCSPDTPNKMGFSYNRINQAMKKYLGVEK